MFFRTSESTDSTFKGDEGMLNMRNVLIDLFIAGSETTSTTLNWAMLFMLRYVRNLHFKYNCFQVIIQ